jgi:putative transposase
MSEKFKHKYRISSARLQTWDYSSSAAYFITICTKNRTDFLGAITNQQFISNSIGDIVTKNWLAIPSYFSFVELGEFIVMPNHTHGILIINQAEFIVSPASDHRL